jgi:hypothetical protein
MLRSPSSDEDAPSFQVNVKGLSNDPTAVEDLAGFGDGSVRSFGNPGSDQELIRFNSAEFFARLSPVDTAATVWTGTFMVADQDGNSVNGAIIGVLVSGPNGRLMLQSLVVSTRGTGLWAGAVGNGHATINWGDGLDGPFAASLEILPAVQHGNQDDDAAPRR